MYSIRFKITAITIAAILASILAVFAASYLIIRDETDQNSVGMMNLIDEDTQKSLEKYFESIEQSVEIAANIAVENLDSVLLVECGAIRSEGAPAQTPEQAAALDAYLHGYCGKVQEYFAGVADYTQGVMSYYYSISPEISQNEHGFYYKKIGKTGFIEHEPLDARLLETDETLGCSWYEATVRCGRPAWIGPYTCDAAWVCSYLVPIYKSGRLIGVMGMDIPCDTLVEQIESIRIYDTGYVCLLDGENRVIYHPDLPIGSDLNDLHLGIDTEILRRDNSGDELIRYKAAGMDHQISYSNFANGMKLICIAPANEINAPWIRLIRNILLISAAAIVIFTVLVMLVMSAVTYPLKQLTDASERLAAGDYDVDLTYNGRNEIGTLTGAFKQMRDRIKSYIDDLNHQLLHDRLTDLPNMRYFFTLAEEIRKKILAEGRHPVLAHFDIIGLRHYNRQYGFDKGDSVLKKFGSILSERFGEGYVSRIGGDSFAAVSDEEHVDAQLRSVLETCETAMDGGRLPVRVGVFPNRLEEVNVNIACDRAKYAGDRKKGELASSVVWFNEDMLRRGEVYRHIINNLDRALAEGWIKVYYQPIVRTADGKVCDEEALARWIDPELGFLSPAQFIHALEESKLIYKLDLYVLEQVLEKMKQQQAAGFYLVPQSINLSRMDFESCDVVEEIRRRVDAAGIDRSMITVEITESVIGSDFDFMKEQIKRFQQLGFPVWMDDFGSGYSSLDVLQRIRFDLIKFDMRFMEHFGEADEGKIILTELMRMTSALGIESLCEGVEQLEQVEFLREIGCTRIQGYYYGKPLPFEGIVELFEKGTSLAFENPAESEYYSAIGRVNLHDLNALTSEGDDVLAQYFNTSPMCVMEVNGTKFRHNRCNRSYRSFLRSILALPYSRREIDAEKMYGGPREDFMKAIVQCGRDGGSIVLDDDVGRDSTAHVLLRRIAVNPVTGAAAVAVAVLAVTRKNGKQS